MAFPKLDLRLAPLLAFAASLSPAAAETISNERDAPIRTSTVANGAAGDIVIDEDGSVEIGADGVDGVTLDTPNSVTLEEGATITAEDVSRVSALRVATGGAARLSNAGSITLTEEYEAEDTDDDDYIDGPFAEGSERIGILVDARAAPLPAEIANEAEGAISIQGNASAGMRLNGPIAGSLRQDGAVTVTGDDSFGVDVRAAVGGDVILDGTTTVTGVRSVGLRIDAPVAGQVRVDGSLSATGYRYTSRPEDEDDDAELVDDGVFFSGSALEVRADAGRGVFIDGVGYEDDQDDDGDGVTEDAVEDDDDLEDDDEDDGAIVSTYGSAPAVAIGSATGAVTLGAGPTVREGSPGSGDATLNIGYGFVNRGTIAAYGIYDGVNSTALSIFGASAAAPTTLANGLRNDGGVNAQATEGNATAIALGDYVAAARLYNNGTITATVTAEGDYESVAIALAAGADVREIINHGTIAGELLGETGDAVAIRAAGSSLRLIENRGSIYGLIEATDEDEEDDEEPVVTGREIALDLRNASGGVTVRQLPSRTRTDQDGEDDSDEPEVEIVGAVLFGTGADTLDLGAGLLEGDVDFGAGADRFRITGGAEARGRFTDADATLDLSVEDGTLAIERDTLRVGRASIGAKGVLQLRLREDTARSSTLDVVGALSFAPGAKIAADLDVLPAEQGFFTTGRVTRTVATAGSIAGFSGVAAEVSAPYLFSATLAQPNAREITLDLRRKSAAELGFDRNETAAYEAAYRAIAADEEVSAAFAGITDEATFDEAYRQLLPTALSASTEMALASRLAIANSALERIGGEDAIAARKVSTWVQQHGGVTERNVDVWGGRWDGWHYGFAVGMDGPVSDGQIGVLAAFQTSEVDDGREAAGVMAQWQTSLGAYWSHRLPGGAFMRTAGLIGAGRGLLDRAIDIDLEDDDRDVTREISGEWGSATGTAHLDFSRPVTFWGLTLTPKVGGVYAVSWDAAYTEEGGEALGLEVDARTLSRAYADARLDGRFSFGINDLRVTPHLGVGWRQRVSGDPAELVARFADGQSFTFIDDAEQEGRGLAHIALSATQGLTHFTLRYDGEAADDFERHTVEARLRFVF